MKSSFRDNNGHEILISLNRDNTIEIFSQDCPELDASRAKLIGETLIRFAKISEDNKKGD